MGMAASQSRLLSLTSRKHNNELQTMKLSNQKIALSRDMQQVSKDYQEALNSKVLKWSSNSGVSYIDLSYSNLMTPSLMNQNSPYLLTDMSGRVVVASNYQRYAEMISPNGSPGGDWESARTSVLSSLTGIDAEKIDSISSYDDTLLDCKNRLDALKADEPTKDRFTKTTNASELLKNMGSDIGVSGLSFSSGSDWSSAYNNSATISLGSSEWAETNLSNILTHLGNQLGSYFMDDAELLQEALETKFTEYTGFINAGADMGNSASGLRGNSSEYKLDVKAMIDEILGAYAGLGGETVPSAYSNTDNYVWYDINSEYYTNWKTEHEEWQAEYDAAVEEYDNTSDAKSQLLTSEEEQEIDFYDAIFSSIAEKGWTYNNNITDTNYLNQMLQNNLYTLTTVDREQVYDENSEEYVWGNSYSTDIASNFTNVYSVNDSDAANEALAEYEYKKSLISAKETRIDTRMQDLETELSAINQMIQGIESVRNDNIERTFGIFS